MRYALAVVAALTLASPIGAQSTSRRCDRACLDGVLTRYLAAVVAHDPSRAPLAEGYRQTENAMVVAAGKGIWRSVTALGKVQHHYLDPVTGGAGFYGTLVEGERGSIATVRLLIEDRQVTEAEWVIGRFDTGTPQADGPGATSVEGAEMTQPRSDRLPLARRTSRRAMIAAANGYFDSVQSGDTTLLKAAPMWVRLENGIGTGEGAGGARRGGGLYPGRAAAQAQGAVQGGATAAGAASNGEVCGGICNVAARRYPIVDEEAGVVLGMVVFQRPPGNTTRRNLLTEWFVFDSGKITGIYAAMHYMKPTFAAPNWAPYDGNFPLSFNVGISPNSNPPAPPRPAN